MRTIARRAMHIDVVAAGLAGASFAVLLFIGRGMTFFADEWVFIEQRSLNTLEGLFAPHNEHWSTLAVLIHRGLFEVFGLRSYFPYLVVLLALHIAVSWAVYRLLLPASRLAALLSLLVVLLLGAGWENLFWAFQVGTVGAAAAGLWSLELARRHTRGSAPVAAALLLAALAFSGTGLYFVPAVAAAMLAAGQSLRRLSWLLLPLAGYAVWYAIAGSGAVAERGNPFSLDALGRLPEFLIAGGSASIDGVLGVGGVGGTAILLILAVGTVANMAARRPDPVWVAAIVALFTQYVLIGLARSQFGTETASLSRYVYTGAIFILLCVMSAWTAYIRQWSPPRMRPVLVGIVALAFLHNLAVLRDGARIFQAHADDTRAIVGAMIEYAGDPTIDVDHSRLYEQPYRVPAPRQLAELVDRFGSPLRDALLPSVVPPVPPASRDAAVVELIRHGISRGHIAELPSGMSLDLIDDRNTAVGREASALTLSATAVGAEALMGLPPGADLAICATAPSLLRVELGQLAAPTAQASVDLLLAGAGECELFSIPDLAHLGWQMRVHLEPAMGELRLTAAMNR